MAIWAAHFFVIKKWKGDGSSFWTSSKCPWTTLGFQCHLLDLSSTRLEAELNNRDTMLMSDRNGRPPVNKLTFVKIHKTDTEMQILGILYLHHQSPVSLFLYIQQLWNASSCFPKNDSKLHWSQASKFPLLSKTRPPCHINLIELPSNTVVKSCSESTIQSNWNIY